MPKINYNCSRVRMNMKKKKPLIQVESYGRYSKWDRESRQLPKIREFTNTIEASEGNEFGMILRITAGKGLRLDYCIKHPPFNDRNGNTEPDFRGEYFVRSNNFEFFIGDCIALPVEDKTGTWKVIVYLKGKEVAKHTFKVILPLSGA